MKTVTEFGKNHHLKKKFEHTILVVISDIFFLLLDSW